MKLKKYINLFVLETLLLKFWLLYFLLPLISFSFIKREDYWSMGSGFAVFAMFYMWISFTIQAYINEKQPLGMRLILTTSYTRKNIIYAKYFTYFMYLTITTIIYSLYTVFVLNYAEMLSFTFFTEIFLFSAVLILILVPISFKCDTGNSFVFRIILFVVPYELLCCEATLRIDKLNIDSRVIFILAIILVSLLFMLSANISKRIFLKKDL